MNNDDLQSFCIPDLGEGLTTVWLHKWHVNMGDVVKFGQLLLTVETAKSMVDVPAPMDGTIVNIPYGSGQMIAVGEPVLYWRCHPAAQHLTDVSFHQNTSITTVCEWVSVTHWTQAITVHGLWCTMRALQDVPIANRLGHATCYTTLAVCHQDRVGLSVFCDPALEAIHQKLQHVKQSNPSDQTTQTVCLVSNFGSSGVGCFGTPKVLPPMVMTLGMGRARPMQNVSRSLPVSLSFDQNYVSGPLALRFLSIWMQHAVT
jgi:Biotin-requiring enzyme/2-oxoacid dehydrogenases acyltransferase (catalytic domain)